MRFINRVLISGMLLLWVVCSAAVASVRWVGQQQPDQPFPLPDARGCWDGLCFFDIAFSEIPAALSMHPRISQAGRLWDQATGLEFVYRGRTLVKLYWNPASYSLTSDHKLMRLGDVVGTLGAPARIMVLEDHVVVEYPARRLYLLVVPTDRNINHVLLSPRDQVDSLTVFQADADQETITFYYPFTQDWKGFGAYYRFP